jgi:hypothetical protein
VVHVVHHTAVENISTAQVQSQIDVLNRDFRKTNPDLASTPAVFAPLVSDAQIEFRLASVDPYGNATNGITRTQTATTSFTHDDAVKFAAQGGHDAWPANKYLNIWVCPLSGGLLGYAQFPGGPPATDGVVILHSAFGTVGTAAPPFHLGRTATHEVGHWLNLFHIWGDDGTACNGTDFVADTPNQGGPNFGVPAFPRVTCNNGPNGDLFMNYMDYVDDSAMFMFTGGQVARMQATIGATLRSAAALFSGSKCYFFASDQYIRVSRGDTGAGTVDPGYPAPISNWRWGSFGQNGIDAALYSGTKCYFFAGDQYIRVTRGDTGAGTVDPGYPAPISNWGWGSFGRNGIDAALYSGPKCYFFAGDQYIRVTRGNTGPGTVDSGYPAPISSWGWGSFGRNGIDAALYSGSKCYFFAGDQYIRVTRGNTGPGSFDPGYPAPIASWRWPQTFENLWVDSTVW